jgi:hypothetical protein
MLIPSLFYGTTIGTIDALVWAFSLNIGFSTSIPIGAVVGFIVALVMVFFGKATRAGSNLAPEETQFVSTAVLTFLGIAGAAIGLLVWLVRVVFF